MSDIFIESLRNRIAALNTLWQRAASDVTLEQVNHHERSGVLPMAFSFNHVMRTQDENISRRFLGEEPLWGRGSWAGSIGVTVDRRGRKRRSRRWSSCVLGTSTCGGSISRR